MLQIIEYRTQTDKRGTHRNQDNLPKGSLLYLIRHVSTFHVYKHGYTDREYAEQVMAQLKEEWCPELKYHDFITYYDQVLHITDKWVRAPKSPLHTGLSSTLKTRVSTFTTKKPIDITVRRNADGTFSVLTNTHHGYKWLASFHGVKKPTISRQVQRLVTQARNSGLRVIEFETKGASDKMLMLEVSDKVKSDTSPN